MINDRFKIEQKLGEGRSSVYLCNDVEFPDTQYAIKILNPQAGSNEIQKFREEYFTLIKLDHLNIIKAREFGSVVKYDGEYEIPVGAPYIKMEYFQSLELMQSSLIKNEKQLREIIKQLCTVLFYLHQSNYIYYDLKPENILISEVDNYPFIKLIDLGLAEKYSAQSEYAVKGTAQYIAPELLKKEEYNHSVDLYSLGMLLYKIVYDKFPFESASEIKIYKAQIEKEFDYSDSYDYSSDLIKTIKKLLCKNPSERFSNSLQVLKALNISIDSSVTKDFVPAKIFSNRNDVLQILNTYLSDASSSEVFTIKGFDGAGKSSLAARMFETIENSIFVNDFSGKSGLELVKFILRKVFYSQNVYPGLSDNQKKSISDKLLRETEGLMDNVPAIVSYLNRTNKLVIIIDDFNLFDELAIEIFDKLIQMLQVQKVKVILFESSERDYATGKLGNVRSIVIGSFTDLQVTEFIENSYAEFIPRKQLFDLIISHADLMPGNIVSFVRDLIMLDLIRFTGEGVIFSDDNETLSVLKKAHFAVYDLRLNNLNEKEVEAACILSALDVPIDIITLSQLLRTSPDETSKIVERLQINNVVQPYRYEGNLNLTSDGFKKHIYSIIDKKTIFHLELANKCLQLGPGFSMMELARQFELAEKYDQCHEVLASELENGEKHSAFSYINSLLNYLLKMPLDEKIITKLKFKLAETQYKISDYKSSLSTISSMNKNSFDESDRNKLLLIESSSLINNGEIEAGKNLISTSLNDIAEKDTKQKLLVELAYAEFEQQNYNSVLHQCEIILKEEDLSSELKGRCFNLLGMNEIYQNNDMNAALSEFNHALENYTIANLPRRAAGTEVNIGNIFNILGNFRKAEERWMHAAEINRSIGNLEQEGKLLLNFGIFYFDRKEFEKAIESNKNAITIFQTLGANVNEGLALINLAEVYLETCEYQRSFESIQQAVKIFESKNKNEELAEALLIYGKLYFRVGCLTELNEIIKKFTAILNENKLVQKHQTNLAYLKLLLTISKNEEVTIEDFKQLRSSYKDLEDRNNYLEVYFLLVEKLIGRGEYTDALKELNIKDFVGEGIFFRKNFASICIRSVITTTGIF
jgi:serine/threonine protein kinase/tetratricopeptide (TPR) repeat protein